MSLERFNNLQITEAQKVRYQLLIEDALNVALTPNNFTSKYVSDLCDNLSIAILALFAELTDSNDLQNRLDATEENYLLKLLGFGEYGDDLFVKLNELTAKIQRIIDYTNQEMKESDYTILPPGTNPTILTGNESPFVKPKIYLKTETIIHILNKLNLDFIVYKGNVERNWVRQTPYSAIIIPDKNLAFLVCNEGGNATFAVEIPSELDDDRKFEFLKWLLNITKEELKKYILGDQRYVVDKKIFKIKGVVIRYKSKSPWKWNEGIVQIVEEGIISDNNTEEADDETEYEDDRNIPKGEIVLTGKFIIIDGVEYGPIINCLKRAFDENPNLILTTVSDRIGGESPLENLARQLLSEGFFNDIKKTLIEHRVHYNYSDIIKILNSKLSKQLLDINENERGTFTFLSLRNSDILTDQIESSKDNTYLRLKDLLSLLRNDYFHKNDIYTYIQQRGYITSILNTRDYNRGFIELIRVDKAIEILKLFYIKSELYLSNIDLFKEIINIKNKIKLFSNSLNSQILLNLWENIQSGNIKIQSELPLKIFLDFVSSLWGFLSIEIDEKNGALLFINEKGIFVHPYEYARAKTNGEITLSQYLLSTIDSSKVEVEYSPNNVIRKGRQIPLKNKTKTFYPKELVDNLINKARLEKELANARTVEIHGDNQYTKSEIIAWDIILKRVPSLFLILGVHCRLTDDLKVLCFKFNNDQQIDINLTIDNIIKLINERIEIIRYYDSNIGGLKVQLIKKSDPLDIFRGGLVISRDKNDKEYFFLSNVIEWIHSEYPDLQSKKTRDLDDLIKNSEDIICTVLKGRKKERNLISRDGLEYIIEILKLPSFEENKAVSFNIAINNELYVKPSRRQAILLRAGIHNLRLRKINDLVIRQLHIRVLGTLSTRTCYSVADIKKYLPNFKFE